LLFIDEMSNAHELSFEKVFRFPAAFSIVDGDFAAGTTALSGRLASDGK
jgi:hypothetical protein